MASTVLIAWSLAGELTDLRQANDRMRLQLTDSQQREKVLVRRLTAKEQETQDYVVSTGHSLPQMFLTCVLREMSVCAVGLFDKIVQFQFSLFCFAQFSKFHKISDLCLTMHTVKLFATWL